MSTLWTYWKDYLGFIPVMERNYHEYFKKAIIDIVFEFHQFYLEH